MAAQEGTLVHFCASAVLPRCLHSSCARVAKMKLTKAAVSKLSLPPGRAELFVYDDELPGFGLRIRRTKKTWFVSYRLGGRGSPQRRLTIGSLSQLDLDAARREARAALARVRLGGDPSQDKTESREQAAATFGKTVDLYLDMVERKLRPRSFEEVKRHLRSHWQSLHGLPLKKIARANVALQISTIAKENGPYASNRARAALSALFSWAIGEGLADLNPVIGTNKATEEVSRDRTLTAEELRLIWNELGAGDFGAIVKLLMLTGQRREEVAAMRWNEIDLESALWRLPRERSKNGLPHDVPLNAPSLVILKGLNRRRKERELVFGEGRGPFSGWSSCKSRLDDKILLVRRKVNPTALLVPWRIHDLRRTVATMMVNLGVLPHVVEAVLNHVSGHKAGVAGIYNRANYAAEKRAALDLWGDYIISLVEEDQANASDAEASATGSQAMAKRIVQAHQKT